ncbi:metallophosphoesterase family protein [Kineobactrum salinum]|uniref:Metallophosphoesterase n=1 Tax=Kineobactrum salinum TaxID=2708301 RepID=A0A6C0U3C2_9GAMM|nr:metallophosphoesterase [Kineobactrum salinum]QIB65939.1 metallophosphoesterase [Kineobactrum salinum]
MIRVLQISDPHFGTQQPRVMAAALALGRQQTPDLVILSGDITQRARRGQFAAARHFVDQFHAPLLAVPGNHDLPLFNLFARLLNPYGNYRRAFGRNLEPEFETDQLLVVGVNSTRPGRHKDGEVSASQIERVAARLSQARPQQLRMVVLHHPVRAAEASDTSNLLLGREQAIPAWVDAGMDVVLGGHIHLPYVLPLYGRDGEAGRRAWTVQAGTALSRRTRGEVSNSVNLISYQPGNGAAHCTLERWDYDAAADGCFHPRQRTTLALNRPS